MQEVRWLNELYARNDRDDPRVSPLLAGDHHGLAPALVLAAGWDPLVDQSEAYAEKLAQAGVPVSRVLYSGAPHGFLSMARALNSARIAREQIATTLASCLHGTSGTVFDVGNVGVRERQAL